VISPEGCCNDKGKPRLKRPTLYINWWLLLDPDSILGFIPEHIDGNIRIYNHCSIKVESAWNLFYIIIFCNPITTCHISMFQPLWRYGKSRSLPFWVWWTAFCWYMGQMFDKTQDQLNNWSRDNPSAFGDQIDRSNAQITSLAKANHTVKCSSCYGSD